MKKVTKSFLIASMMIALVAGAAEAGKGGGGKPGSGGGGTPTNYGCQTFPAGYKVTSTTSTSTKTLLTSTYACYLCNMTTRACQFTSPSSLVGWGFILP